MTVGNSDVDIMMVGNSDVDIMTVGNLDVNIMTVCNFDVDKRTKIQTEFLSHNVTKTTLQNLRQMRVPSNLHQKFKTFFLPASSEHNRDTNKWHCFQLRPNRMHAHHRSLRTKSGMHLCVQDDQNGQRMLVLPSADKTTRLTCFILSIKIVLVANNLVRQPMVKPSRTCLAFQVLLSIFMKTFSFFFLDFYDAHAQ
jgi:hypothetical protein